MTSSTAHAATKASQSSIDTKNIPWCGRQMCTRQNHTHVLSHIRGDSSATFTLFQIKHAPGSVVKSLREIAGDERSERSQSLAWKAALGRGESQPSALNVFSAAVW